MTMTLSAIDPHLSVFPAEAPLAFERNGQTITLRVPKGVEASVVETFASQGDAAYATELKLEIHLEEGARLTHYKWVDEGPRADHYSFLEVHVARRAAFHSHVFLFEGARIRNTIQVRLDGEEAECSLNGLYLGSGEQVIESHTLIEHRHPHGTSREFYKGILDQKSQGLFDGLIMVQKEAQKTDSTQTNRNLLLSSQARAKSNPELKILANDVKCKHGSTIGQIDATHLFYLCSRGIPQAEAKRLLIYAFASEMINPVTLVPLREALEQRLLEKFGK